MTRSAPAVPTPRRWPAAGEWSQEVTAGTRLPWLGEFGLQLVAGRLPDVAARADGVPARSALIEPWHRVCGYVAVPILAGAGVLAGVLCGFSARPGVTALDRWARQVRLFAQLLATVVTAERQADSVREALDRASELAEVDALTGVRNRRGWCAGLARESQRCASYDILAGVLAIDLDQFKTVNDVGGHAAGDAVYNARLGSWSTSAGPATSWRAPAVTSSPSWWWRRSPRRCGQ